MPCYNMTYEHRGKYLISLMFYEDLIIYSKSEHIKLYLTLLFHSSILESSCPVTDGLYMEQMYQELAVPVYTTIKGVKNIFFKSIFLRKYAVSTFLSSGHLSLLVSTRRDCFSLESGSDPQHTIHWRQLF